MTKYTRLKLAKHDFKKCSKPDKENKQERRYKNYKYSGEFHKALEHNIVDGRLSSPKTYEKMRAALIKNDQKKLAAIPLATGSQMVLANPLASLSTPLVGGNYCKFHLPEPPHLSSNSAAADILEDYAMALARDIPFVNYSTDATITTLLNTTHMNNESIIDHLKYYTPKNTAFTSKTIFTGLSADEQNGPYISQLLLLDVQIGGCVLVQKYKSYVSRQDVVPSTQIEWGINKDEMIALQNGHLTSLPLNDPANSQHTYIYNGRALGEAVHNDTAYQYYFQAANILSSLGAKPNPGFPVYPNQGSFITGSALANIVCSIGEVTALALKHSWYWKWQQYRKLRPEVFSLWVDNVMTDRVQNYKNYDIKNSVLDNDILSDIYLLYSSYTLPLCYREGSPTHPSYPAGHAVCAGANCTLLKIFYDAEQLWSSLGSPVIQSDDTGANLIPYTGADYTNMTIGSEINKLASNISLGRNWAGVHYRTDSMAGMILGEDIAIKYMEDYLSANVEKNLDGTVPHITFRKFDGTLKTIKPALKN
jgi:hypothetical protein